MKYFIVTQEWLYPTESGRDLVGDFDTLEEALEVAKELYEEERDNFLKVNKTICNMLSGPIMEDEGIRGYILNSTYKPTNSFFRTVVIEREV